MKIALIQCPVWGTYDPPLALAQLSACLKKERNEVYVFDLNIKLYLNRKENYKNMWAWEQSLFWYDAEQVNKFFRDNDEDIESYVRDIMNTGARVIGFSVSAASRLSSIELAKRLKEKDRDLIIVFGGPLFFEKRFIDSILNEQAVDIVIPEEGEVVLCELLRLIEQNQNITFCKGISFKKDDRIINTGSKELLSNLDNLPFLDFTDLSLSDYDDPRHIPFMASRGCTQRCVFCSSRTFWPGYRTMSGERIFKEIEFHRNQQSKLNPDFGHVDFWDLLFNGNMRSLSVFCDLMRKAKIDIYWTANMIIGPQMNLEVIKKMKEAGCEHIIFGIESGSQRVLDLMKKRYRVEDADRILRWMHEAGIIVTCNFMFGFPGETEEDFQMTLDFLRKNHKFLDRVYPSRTYCAIEEFSYLHNHVEEFGIKTPPPNHLYWESVDGKNTYPIRLERCEKFCELAYSLGIEVGCGVQTSVELDKYYNLGFYYEFKNHFSSAIKYFLNYHNLDSANEVINKRLCFYYKKSEQNSLDIAIDKELVKKLEETITDIKEGRDKMSFDTITVPRLEREESISLLRHKQAENSSLNDKEFESKKISLNSSPKAFFLQVAGPCNSRCVFCSRGRDYDLFDLNIYRERFEEKIDPFLVKAERIILTGSGEYLFLHENRKILDYFDTMYPHVEKMFSTNGSSLTPEICKRIAYSKSKYTIHLSLHASNSAVHRLMTRTENFQKIIENIKCLMNLKKKTGNPIVRLIFVATTLNIEDLPNFLILSYNLGIDKVICYYNYIYVPAQKYLSCFFKQDLTNKILDEVGNLASKLNISIDLPPRFVLKLKDYPKLGPCREAWSQIMLNFKGNIIPCDASEDTEVTLENKDFMDVWNGQYYVKLRSNLLEGKSPCFFHCFRANLPLVNNFYSHVIHRGRKDSPITEFWEDNF